MLKVMDRGSIHPTLKTKPSLKPARLDSARRQQSAGYGPAASCRRELCCHLAKVSEPGDAHGATPQQDNHYKADAVFETHPPLRSLTSGDSNKDNHSHRYALLKSLGPEDFCGGQLLA
jgi:hypothetical protein